MRRHDGTEVPILKTRTETELGGELVRLETFVDIRGQKKAVEALRERETLLRSLLNAIPIPVYHQDCGGAFTGFNTSFADFFGVTEANRKGKPVIDVVPPYATDPLQGNRMGPGSENEVQEYDCTVVNAKGDARRVHLRKSLFKDGKGKIQGLIGTVIDFTERKRAEESAEEKRRLAAIGALAAGMAHEINNPIMGILNYAQLIEDRLGPEDEITAFTSEISHEGQRVAAIVRKLQLFEQQGKQLQRAISIPDVIAAATSPLLDDFEKEGISIKTSVAHHLPEVVCHAKQIEHVVRSLVDNARDALNRKNGTGTDEKRITITAGSSWQNPRGQRLTDFPVSGVKATAGRQGSAVIVIEDNGTGVPESIRKRILDPFYTTKDRSQGSGIHKGSGLNLAICHAILENHGGGMTIETEDNVFTRISIRLPFGSRTDTAQRESGHE